VIYSSLILDNKNYFFVFGISKGELEDKKDK